MKNKNVCGVCGKPVNGPPPSGEGRVPYKVYHMKCLEPEVKAAAMRRYRCPLCHGEYDALIPNKCPLCKKAVSGTRVVNP